MEIKIDFSKPSAKFIFVFSAILHGISLLFAWRTGMDAQFSMSSFGYDTVDYSLNGFETYGWLIVLLVLIIPCYHFFKNKPFSRKALIASQAVVIVSVLVQMYLMFVVVSSHNITSDFEFTDSAHVLDYKGTGRWIFVFASIVTLYSVRKVSRPAQRSLTDHSSGSAPI